MRSSPTRRGSLLDAMAFIAATAIGLAATRTYSLEVLNNELSPYPFVPRVLLATWSYILAVLPIVAMWSVAVFLLSLRRPRPCLPRLARRPGFVACGAVTLVGAIRLAGALTLVARTLGNPWYRVSPGIGEVLSVRVSFPGPVNYATVYNSAYFAASAFGMSAAVAAAWLLLAASGRWRSEPAWLDRLGRGLGCYWIGIVPFSCWWDYHVLY